MDYPRRVVDGVSVVIWIDQMYGFGDTAVFQFLDFGNWVGLQMPIDALFGGLWGTLSPNDVTHRPNPKTAILGLNHVI